jgi:hypothetical protein
MFELQNDHRKFGKRRKGLRKHERSKNKITQKRDGGRHRIKIKRKGRKIVFALAFCLKCF